MRIRSIFSAAILLASAVTLHAQRPFTNPVIAKPGMHAEVADPFVLKWNGEYYLYTSGDPITAYHSENLVHWDFIGPVVSSSKDPNAWNQADVWAPEVVYRDGKFYLYYTATRKSDSWEIGEMARRVGVAISDSPRGPFVDIGRPVTPGWAIDGHVFKDPDDGREYLFYSYLDEAQWKGAGLVVDQMTAPDRVAGRPAMVTRGTEAWEDKDGDPHNGSVRYTNEAPTVIKRDGRYYIMYSGGSWDLPTYSLAYATSDKVVAGDLSGPGWSKVVPPLLRSTPLVDAPGHNTLTKAPNNVDDFSLYHARAIPFLEPWNRMPFVDRVYWNHDRMFMQQPSTGALTLPDTPMFRDNFNRTTAHLGASWKLTGEPWSIEQNQLRQASSNGTAIAVSQADALTHYVFEANLRFANKPISSARAGVAAVLLPSGDRVDVVIDPERHVLVVAGFLAGKRIEQSTATLPDGFNPQAYHQLLITRNGNLLSIALDGVNLHKRTLPLNGTPSHIGLVTTDAAADFDGIALTAFYEEFFNEPASDWESLSGSWRTEAGALHAANNNPPAVALKGQLATDYEFSASVLWNESDGSKPQPGSGEAPIIGIVTAATASGEQVRAGFDRNIWPLARFRVQHFISGKVQKSFAVAMPRGFRHDEYHTIRVVKSEDRFTFFLDGAETLAAHFNIGAARPGLFTDSPRASFDDARYKRLGVTPNLLLNASFETEQWDAGKPVSGNPWTLSGNAREHYCCAHSGLRRLLFQPGNGSATQAVSNLTPGRYELRGWAFTSAGTQVQINAGAQNTRTVSSSTTGESWKEFRTEFELEWGHSEAKISISANPGDGAYAAVDDLYLSKID